MKIKKKIYLYGSFICESSKTLKQVLSNYFLSFFSNVQFDQIRHVYLGSFHFMRILIVSCVVIFSSWSLQAQDIKTD